MIKYATNISNILNQKIITKNFSNKKIIIKIKHKILSKTYKYVILLYF